MSKFKIRGLCAAALTGLVAVGLAAPAVAAVPAGQTRVIVMYKDGAAAKIKQEVAGQGGRVVLDIGEMNAVAVTLPNRAIAVLKKSRNVESIETDHPQRTLAVSEPSGPPYQLGQQVPYGIKMVQADLLPDTFASNQKVCIIDAGYDIGNPDLATNPVAGENLTTSGQWFTDENQHGTHVAGTIAAIDQVGEGVVGVLPNKNLNLYIVKVFDASGSTSSSTVAKAMLRCNKAGAKIVSMSLGGSAPNSLQQKVVKFLSNRGVLLIAAAGNSGNTAISYPAGFAEVVSVAAVDDLKVKASFSQFNADVEIAGPGVNTLSTLPVGKGTSATLTVAATPYTVLGMVGSPNASATAPLADFGLGDTPAPGSMGGRVCLIQRGNISFSDKVLNCQSSGGLGAVIYNNVPGELAGTLNGVVTTIPSVGATDVAGAAMLGQLGQFATVAVSTSDYGALSGTSMATPHVAAVAALVWSYFPNCTAAQIRTSLNNSAEDLGTPGRDTSYGFGLVRAKSAFDRITALGCGV